MVRAEPSSPCRRRIQVAEVGIVDRLNPVRGIVLERGVEAEFAVLQSDCRSERNRQHAAVFARQILPLQCAPGCLKPFRRWRPFAFGRAQNWRGGREWERACGKKRRARAAAPRSNASACAPCASARRKQVECYQKFAILEDTSPAMSAACAVLSSTSAVKLPLRQVRPVY